MNTDSLADTCYLAARARSKLTKEASRHDHNLRVLVSHANLLDSLMENLQKQKLQKLQQEREEREVQNQKVQFQLPVKPVADEDNSVVYVGGGESDSDSDSDSDYSDDEYYSSEDDDEFEIEIEQEQDDDEHYSRSNHRTMPTIEEDYDNLVLSSTQETKTAQAITISEPAKMAQPVAIRPLSPPQAIDVC